MLTGTLVQRRDEVRSAVRPQRVYPTVVNNESHVGELAGILDRPSVYSATADTGRTIVQGPCSHFVPNGRVVAPTWQEAGGIGRCHFASAVRAIRAAAVRCSQIRYRTVLIP